MFKRMFQFSTNENETTIIDGRNGSGVHSSGVVKLSTAVHRESEKPSNGSAGAAKMVTPVIQSFEEVYANAGIRTDSKSYSIMKIAEMLNSKHLADMTPDGKRNSLMMALEAAGVEIGELLQDAVGRNRVLDEYEDQRQEQLKTFESIKTEENDKLHAEMDRLTSQYMTRIQVNADQIAEEQDKFRAWQKRKQQESQRITDAATFCVPQGNGSSPNGLNAVLERASMPRR
jgi:hypothetical protein